MKKILIIIIVSLYSNALAHMDHYKKINKIEMDIFRNGELIGYNYYFFTRKGNKTTVTNQIKFSVKLFGTTIFQVEGYGEEKYINDQLISYDSKTLQNDKEKFVNLVFDKEKNKFKIVETVKKIASSCYDSSKLLLIDGLRVTNEQGWWLLRASNTQAALIIRAESTSSQNLETLINEINIFLNKAGFDKNIHDYF